METLKKQLIETRNGYVAKYDEALQAELTRQFNVEMSWLNSLILSDTKLRAVATNNPVSMCKVLANVVTTGLSLAPALKLCYVIVRRVNGKPEATLDISYMGLIKLVTRNGSIAKVEANVVYDNDTFECEYGLNPKFRHVPAMVDRGKMLAVYAIAHIRGAEPQIEVLTRDDIADIKGASQGGEVWLKWPAQMWRKSAIRRLFKYLPQMDMTDELITAMSIEYRNESTMLTEGDVSDEVLTEIFEHGDGVLDEGKGETKAAKPKGGRKAKTEPKKGKEPAKTATTVVEVVPQEPQAQVETPPQEPQESGEGVQTEAKLEVVKEPQEPVETAKGQLTQGGLMGIMQELK